MNSKLNWLSRSSKVLVDRLSDWSRGGPGSSRDLGVGDPGLGRFDEPGSVDRWRLRTVVGGDLYRFCSSPGVKPPWARV